MYLYKYWVEHERRPLVNHYIMQRTWKTIFELSTAELECACANGFKGLNNLTETHEDDMPGGPDPEWITRMPVEIRDCFSGEQYSLRKV